MPGHLAVRLIVPALAAAALAALPAAACAGTVVTRVGGEALTHAGKRTSAVRVIRERAATDGRSVMLSGAVSVAGTATLPVAADHLAVRVRAKACGGAPVLQRPGRRQAGGRPADRVHPLPDADRQARARRGRPPARGDARPALGAPRLPAAAVRRRHRPDDDREGRGARRDEHRRAAGRHAGRRRHGAGHRPGDRPGDRADRPAAPCPRGLRRVARPLPVGGLLWAPPPLVAPTTITVPDGNQWYDLDTSKDYIIKLPSYAHNGSLGLQGGRNVVLQGGHIRLPASLRPRRGAGAARQRRDRARRGPLDRRLDRLQRRRDPGRQPRRDRRSWRTSGPPPCAARRPAATPTSSSPTAASATCGSTTSPRTPTTRASSPSPTSARSGSWSCTTSTSPTTTPARATAATWCG